MRIPKVIPPGTIIKHIKLWPNARKQGHEIGDVWEVGFYCKCCGSETIWLVDKKGEYSWTMDRDFLLKHFEIIKLSKSRKIFSKSKNMTSDEVTEYLRNKN